MKNSFELIGGSGKNYGYSKNSNSLKDRFMESGEEYADVVARFVSDPPKLRVTKDTPNSVWNDFSRKYAINGPED